MFLDACRGGYTTARLRATALAIELRADLTLAELALADGELLIAGTAYLDAGFPELAAEPLRKFVAHRPAGASVATEALRVEGVAELLAIAERKSFDVARAIEQALVRATHATGGAVATAYVHAARLARLGKLDARLPSILAAAQRACPDDPEIAALLESRLFDANNTDRLLDHYRGRFERAPSRIDYIGRMRAAGLELIARNHQPAAGLRFLRMSLEQAYEGLLPDVASHIATWELIVAHARAQHTLRELVPLIVQAMAAPVSDDVAVYLARLGLEIVVARMRATCSPRSRTRRRCSTSCRTIRSRSRSRTRSSRARCHRRRARRRPRRRRCRGWCRLAKPAVAAPRCRAAAAVGRACEADVAHPRRWSRGR